MRKSPVTRIFVSAAPDGRIKAKIYRGQRQTESLMFNTVHDLFEWPEITDRTEVEFTAKGIVPNTLVLPCEPIFYFCSPDEVMDFMALTRSGDRLGWMERYTALIKSVHAEQFNLENMVGTSIDLTDLISNPIALQVIQPLLNGINWLADNISIIGPAVLALAGAFAVFQIAAHWTEIAAAATAIYHGVVNFLSIGFGILTGNTAAASAAVFTFNSALLANPIVWVVMLIMILIGALYAAVAAVNKFKGTSVSATGIIAGAFAVLGAFLINSFIVPAQNGFARFANFIGNVFNNPIAAVEVAFYDMFLTVLGYISKLAHAIEDVINKIPGVTVDITSGLDNFYAGIEKAQQKVKDESGWVEYVKKMDFIDYSDAASAGYKFGQGIDDKVSGFFGGGLDSIDAFNMGNAWDGIYGNTADTAANTAATAEALDVAEEDLAYLRDIAEREAINRFTTAEIKVEQHNENHIASELDVDGIMAAWTESFAEQLAVSAEGVHE